MNIHCILALTTIALMFFSCVDENPSSSQETVKETVFQDPPIVTIESPTNNVNPIWTWDIPENAVDFRYSFKGSGWITCDDISITSFTPATSLSEGTHFLMVQAQNPFGFWSTACTAQVVIDTTKPKAPTITGDTLTKNKRPSFKWVLPADVKTVQYSLNSYNWQTISDTSIKSYTSPKDLKEGKNLFYMTAIDAAGNKSSINIFTTEIDNTPPMAPVVIGLKQTNLSKPSWQWDRLTDYFKYQVKINDTDWDTITTNKFTSKIELDEGDYFFKVKASDKIGNWSNETIFNTKIVYDSINAPVVYGDSFTTKFRPTWNWSSEDQHSIARCRIDSTQWVTINNSTETSYTSSKNLSLGKHLFEIQLKGINEKWSALGSFTTVIDTFRQEAPIVSGPKITNSLRPYWNWSISYSYDEIRYRINGGEWTTIPGNQTNSLAPLYDLNEGVNTFEIEARHNNKNWSYTGSSETIIDITPPPVPEIVSPTVSNKVNFSFIWHCEASDLRKIIFKIENIIGQYQIDLNDSLYKIPYKLDEGTYNIYLYAVDSIGNLSDNNIIPITIDLTSPDKPSIEIETPSNNSNPLFKWKVPEETEELWYNINSTNWIEIIDISVCSTHVSHGLSNGIHKIFLKCKDLAGNWSDISTNDFLIDTIPPESPTLFLSDTCYNRYPMVRWERPAGAIQFRYRFESEDWKETNNLSYRPLESLTEGVKIFQIQAIDTAKNTSPIKSDTIFIAPCSISGLTVSKGVASDSVRINWSKDSRFTNYIIYRGRHIDSVVTAVDTISDSLFVDLKSYSAHWNYYGVEGLSKEHGVSEMSILDSGYCLLKSPKKASASMGDTSIITFRWQKVDGAEKYFVYMLENNSSTITDTNDLPLIDTVLAPYTYYRQSDTKPGVDYEYRVKAWAPLTGESGFSNYSIGEVICKPATELDASTGYIDYVKIVWKSSPNANVYVVSKSYKHPNGPWHSIGQSVSTSFIDNNVADGDVFYYRVISGLINDAGNGSDYSNTCLGKVDHANVPSTISATSYWSDKVVIKWNAVSTSKGYTLYRSNTYDGTYQEIGKTTEITFTDTNVSSGRKYYYKIKAGGFGKSNYVIGKCD